MIQAIRGYLPREMGVTGPPEGTLSHDQLSYPWG